MKKISVLVGSFLLANLSFSQNFELKSLADNSVKFEHSLDEIQTMYSTIGNQEYINYGLSSPVTMKEKGAPELPMFSQSLVLPNHGAASINIEHDGYEEFTNVFISPSKGSLKRNVTPSSVPFTFGAAYSEDAFFPGNLAKLNDPFVLRTTRGATVTVFPYQYNPVTKTLRVYKNIRVTVNTDENLAGMNEIENSQVVKDEFSSIYQNMYINASVLLNRYTPKEETGDMLVICPASYNTTIQSLVDWKNQKGIKTTVATTAQTGTTAANIKAYIQSFYGSNPNLIYVLLVGDHAEVPSYSYGTSSEGEALWSDTYYAQLAGGANDLHPDVFIGRFSGTTAQVSIMVNRTLEYEKTPAAGDWMNKAIGLASNEGAGQGDDGEADWQHARNIRTKLLNFGYGTVHEFYDGSQGGSDATGNPNATTINTAVNAGVGLFNYTGHGDQTSMVSGNYSSTSISSATNTNKYPWVISVACNNGTFTSGTCISENWLRAANGTTPKGAIVACGSSILMAWAEPMQTQDEIAEIISESYANNKKRTIGGIFYNSQLSMMESYNNASSNEVVQTWVMFGDPSTLFRTKQTQTLDITHVSSVSAGTTSISVNCSTEGALICITQNNVILGTGYVSGGVAVITVPAISGSTDLLVTGTNQNYAAYQGPITIGAAAAPSVSIASSNNSAFCQGTSVTFTATPTNGGSNPTYQWQVNGANVGTNSPTFTSSTLTNGQNVTCNITANGTPASSNTITVSVNAAPATPAVSSNSPVCQGSALNLTTSAVSGATYAWTGPNGFTSSVQNPTIPNTSASEGGSYELIITANGCSSANGTNSVTVSPSVTPTVSSSITSGQNPFCAGESITFTAGGTNGGTSPVYQWTVNGSNVGTGTSFTSNSLNNNDVIACVLTSNANCATSSTANSSPITMQATSATTPTVSITNSSSATCTGESITINASGTNGGSSPVYQWAVNGTNTTTGASFTSSSLNNGDVVNCVMTSNSACATTNTANSNNITISVTPAVTPSIQIAATGSTSICEGNPVTFNGTANNGGTAPTYQWSVNGVNAGTGTSFTSSTLNNGDVVTCILTSNAACATTPTANSNPLTVNVSDGPTVTTTSNSPLCEGDNLLLSCNNTPGATYTWSGPAGFSSTSQNPTIIGSNTNAAGTYTLTVNANGCTSTSDVTVNVSTTPSTPTVFINDNLLTSSSPTGNQWYMNGIIIQGATSQTLTATQAGDYTVVVSNNGCTSGTSNLVHFDDSGISDISGNISFKVYPNPSTGVFTIEFSTVNTNVITIQNVIGQVVYTETIQDENTVIQKQIDLNNLGKGEYFITISNETSHKVEKLVIL
jgi:gingipain R